MKKIAPPSVRTLVALIVIAPVVAAAAVLVTLSTVTNRRIAENLGSSIVDSATARVSAQVKEYLSEAVRVSDLYERRLARGVLKADGAVEDWREWERLMLDDLVTSPDVASICFGNAAGDATWLLRGPKETGGGLEVGRVDGSAAGAAAEYFIGLDGRLTEPAKRVYTYDPRQRPWYAAAAGTSGAVWTPVYFWYGNQGADSTTGTGYTRAIRLSEDPTRSVGVPRNEVAGVLVIDVTLGAISDFLKRLPLAQSGYVFVVDGEGLLVAASDGPVNSDAGQRLALKDASLSSKAGPIGRAVAAAMAGRGSDGRLFRVDADGQPARAKVTALSPYPGINWSVIAVIPEASFLSEAGAMQRRAVILAALVSLGGLVLGLWLSRRLSRPLLKLTEHVKRVGAGDFDSRLELHEAKELEELSGELNKAAGGLRERMELQNSLAVAVEVQQALLPLKDPTPPRLDVAGRTRYCDATGGDYFDFVDVARLGGSRTLIALGDVMGHGIAAALLMASARAAVRAYASEEGSLAPLMTKVNRVLSADARHRRFMTLSLLVLDAESGKAWWASAGHDPPIVYHAAEDRFSELEGGSVPLAIDVDIEYEEYQAEGLRPGDLILMGTDGIWEMHNEEKKLYGKARLREFMKKHHARASKEIAVELQKELDEFRGAARAEDDVTFVIVKMKA